MNRKPKVLILTPVYNESAGLAAYEEAVRATLLSRNAVGEPFLFQGVLIDLTARLDAERKAAEAEERFRELVELSPVVPYSFQLMTDDHGPGDTPAGEGAGTEPPAGGGSAEGADRSVVSPHESEEIQIWGEVDDPGSVFIHLKMKDGFWWKY